MRKQSVGHRYIVKTQDVDGSSRREFVRRDRAIERFESMLGYPIATALAEQFWQRKDNGEPVPTLDDVFAHCGTISGVSNYGTKVSISAVQN